jgi:hypothetical protein
MSMLFIWGLLELGTPFNKIKIEKIYKQNKEKSRYRFILGQLYEELGKKDSDLQLWVGNKYESKNRKENMLFKHKLEKRSCLTIKMGIPPFLKTKSWLPTEKTDHS